MKTLLLLTDFSSTANYAVAYGYDFAKLLEAEVILCNVVNIPAEIPQYETILLPFGNHDLIEEQSIEELKRLKTHLEHRDHNKAFHPSVSYVCETGVMTDKIDDIVSKRHIDLIIMGTRLAIEGGCNAVASTVGNLAIIGRKFAHKIPLIAKLK